MISLPKIMTKEQEAVVNKYRESLMTDLELSLKNAREASVSKVRLPYFNEDGKRISGESNSEVERASLYWLERAKMAFFELEGLHDNKEINVFFIEISKLETKCGITIREGRILGEKF